MTRRPEEDEELVPLPVERHRPPSEPTERAGLDRKWRDLGLGALLVVLVGAALVGRGDEGPAAERSAVSPAPGGGDEPAPPGWRRGAPGPLRYRDFAVRVWTGSELVVWGGDPDGDSGAAYDPATDRWRMIAAAPLAARCQGASVWSGREVLVWGEACRLRPGPSPGSPRSDLGGAAYDPAADRWRPLPPGPVTGGQSVLSVWTGTEWVVANAGGPAAAFDPASDRWRTLPAVPRPYASIAGSWTGREVVVLGVDVVEDGPSTGAAYRHWAAALDPVAGRWRDLPDPPLELAATAVWDGKQLVAWDQNLRSATLDPAPGGRWEPRSDLPVEFTDCSPQGTLLGEVVFAGLCGRGALFSAAAGTWERIPHPRSLAELPVWTGEEALFWVGSFAGSADGVWLYRP